LDGEVLEFATRAGHLYTVLPSGAALEQFEVVELSGSEEEGCPLGIGGPFEAMSWRDFDPEL